MKSLVPTAASYPVSRLAQFIFVLLLTALARPAQAQWVAQPFAFDSPEVFAYTFGVVDANVVWAAGYDENLTNRSVARTLNGGQSWALRTVTALSLTESITSISATSALNAWVSTADTVGGRLLHTTDGGLTWTAPAAPVFGVSTPTFVHFFSATNGVAVADPDTAAGSPFKIFVTRDGGLTWRPATTVPPALTFESGTVLAPAVVGNALWFVTDESRVFTSVDQGDNWLAAVANTTSSETYALAFTDAFHGVVLSIDNNNVLYEHATTDGGLTWLPVNYTGQLFAAGITGVPGAGLLVSVGAGELGASDVGSSYSRDNGVTWQTIETTQYHTGVAAFSAGAVWSGAVTNSLGLGFGQGVYRLPATALARRSAAQAASAAAYPNPNATGEFRLPLPAAAATVRVTDALGREIWRAVTAAGQAELALSLRGQTAGVYTLTVQTAAGIARQQLVIQ